MIRLSVVIPAYNERATVQELLARVARAPLPEGVELDMVVVDDGSKDGTRELLRELVLAGQTGQPPFRLVEHAVNRGKGAAIRSGFLAAEGDILLVQDADLEYDPVDYPALLAPLLAGPHRVLFFWHSVGNRLLTMLSNMLTDINLSDMETCYKVFRREVLDPHTLRSNRFGIEPELTARFARRRARIYEVPISYRGRTYAEGKKIGWKDGFSAIWAIIRYNLFS